MRKPGIIQYHKKDLKQIIITCIGALCGIAASCLLGMIVEDLMWAITNNLILGCHDWPPLTHGFIDFITY